MDFGLDKLDLSLEPSAVELELLVLGFQTRLFILDFVDFGGESAAKSKVSTLGVSGYLYIYLSFHSCH